MAVIHIPRKTYRQPQGRVIVDWSNTLAVGLVHAAIDGVDAASNRPGVVLNGVSRGLQSGIARSFSGSSGSYDEFAIEHPETLESLSIAALWVRRATTIQRIASWSFSSALRGATLSPDASGNIRALVASIGSNRILVGPGTALNAEQSSVLRYDRGNLALTHNGVSDWEMTVPQTSISCSTQKIRLGIDDADSSRLNGLVAVSAAWTRSLSQSEAEEWSRNPWQIFKSDPRRIYSFPASGIPTISNILMTNIRSNQATSNISLLF